MSDTRRFMRRVIAPPFTCARFDLTPYSRRLPRRLVFLCGVSLVCLLSHSARPVRKINTRSHVVPLSRVYIAYGHVGLVVLHDVTMLLRLSLMHDVHARMRGIISTTG